MLGKIAGKLLPAVLLVVCFALLWWWWASSGYPTKAQICDPPGSTQNCADYHILLALTWKIAKELDHWSALITALATGAIAYFTWTIWNINQNQLKHAHQVERAYVFARVVFKAVRIDGTMIRGVGISNPEPVQYVEVVFDNHGKTPAYVSELALSSCLVEELPKPADLPVDYERSKLLANLSIGPGAVEIPTYRRRELREAVGKVMYGRVYYTDIFGESHSTGFIYRVLHGGIAAPFEAAPEYTAWD